MITNPEVFKDHHIPQQLRHRDGPKEALSDALEPAVDGESAENVLISGVSGVGKTLLARYILQDLDEYAPINYHVLRCFESSAWELLREAIDEHPSPTETQGNETVDELVTMLRETVHGPYVLVLDEADSLPDISLLDHLHRAPKVSFVAICHDREEWLTRVDEDVQRSMAPPIPLDRYHVDELASILDKRAEKGLRGDVVDEHQLEAIADEVAGVARYGIRSLEAAAEIAAERGHDEIRDEDVDDCYPRAKRKMRRSNLRSLPRHHQIIYSILYQWGPLSSADLNRRYEKLADELYHGSDQTPVSRRERRKKLLKLREYDLVERVGSGNPIHDVLDEEVGPLADVEGDLRVS